jgi:hypothetical protein
MTESTIPETLKTSERDTPDPLAPLLNGTLAAHVFDHRCHVFVAWATMRRYGIVIGAKRFREALKAYVAHLGAADKYHVTITEAFLRLIAYEVALDAGESDWVVAWANFEVRAGCLFMSSHEVLALYYSKALIDRAIARQSFVQPDLSDLPNTILDDSLTT